MAPSTTAVDQSRIAGIDRRTVVPALLVLALAVLMSVVLPSIDNETAYSSQIAHGDVAQLADGITLVPAAGWDLTSGALVGQVRSPVGSTATTQLVIGSVRFTVQAAPFSGTPSALLRRINRINDDLAQARGGATAMGRHYRVATREGVVGVAENFVGVARQGSVLAFVFRTPPAAGSQGQPMREGVEVVVSGPDGPLSRRRDEIVAMIRSIRVGS
jgi:hypothetical protein